VMISKEASATFLQIFTDFFLINLFIYFSPFSESSPISGLAGKRNATTTELLAEAEGEKLFFYITRTARNSGVGGERA